VHGVGLLLCTTSMQSSAVCGLLLELLCVTVKVFIPSYTIYYYSICLYTNYYLQWMVTMQQMKVEWRIKFNIYQR
jgi:hypothetical protein